MNRANGMSLGERAKSNAALARSSFEFVDPVLFMATLNRKALEAEKTVKANRNNRYWLTQFTHNRRRRAFRASTSVGRAWNPSTGEYSLYSKHSHPNQFDGQ